MGIAEATTRLKTAIGEYDFAVDGGAVGSIIMRGDATVPAGSIVIGGLIEVLTAFTTGTAATLAITLESAGDMQAAAVVSGAPWSTLGRKPIVPVFTAASSVKATAARSLTAVIATGTITAGKARVILFYL